MEHRSACRFLSLEIFGWITTLTQATPVTPTTVSKLLEKGFTVNVERSPVRIFEDKEFEDVGAKLVATGSWHDAPKDHIIIGLKELKEEGCKLFRLDFCDFGANVDCEKFRWSIPISNLPIAIKVRADGIKFFRGLQLAAEHCLILNFLKTQVMAEGSQPLVRAGSYLHYAKLI